MKGWRKEWLPALEGGWGGAADAGGGAGEAADAWRRSRRHGRLSAWREDGIEGLAGVGEGDLAGGGVLADARADKSHTGIKISRGVGYA